MNRPRLALVTAAFTAAVLIVAPLTACSTTSSPTSSISSRSSTAIADPSQTPAASVTTTSVSLAPSTAGFTPGSRKAEGTAANGSTWNLSVPQVSGGEKRIAQAYNAALDATADRIIAGAGVDQKTTITDGDLTPAEHSRTVVARTTISGVMIVLGAADGAAYPARNVETAVIDPRTAGTLSLDAIFTDPVSAKQQLASLAVAADATGRLAEAAVDPQTLQQWIALDQGLHLYVPVIHAMGDYVPVTVPWSQLTDLMNTNGRILFVA